MSFLSSFVMLFSAATAFFVALPALALDAQVCIEENETGSALRARGSLREASEHYLACASTSCPEIVREECQSLLERTEASIPTLIFAAVDANGNDTSTAELFVDGVRLLDTLDGRAIPVDPGSHQVRIQTSSGASAERTIIAREAEKNRLVRLELTPAPAAVLPPSAPAISHTAAARSTATPDAHTAAWLLSAAAAAGFVSFGYFALQGNAAETALQRCAPACQRPDVEDMRRDYLIADVSLGVGVLALGSATYLFLKPHSEVLVPLPPKVGVSVNPGLAGLALHVNGHF